MKFEITYEIRGTRKVEIVVPDSVQLPDDWSRLAEEDKDSWIYTHQTSSKDIFEDIDYARATYVEWAD